MLKNNFAATRFLCNAFFTLLLIALVLVLPAMSGANTWQWQNNGANERVIINLDEAEGPLQAKRNGLHSVLIPFKANGTLSLDGASPDAGKLASGLSLGPDGITLQLQNSAFGYLLRQVSPSQIIIDIFPDPLGARWQADGNLAPVGTEAKAVATVGQIENVGQASLSPVIQSQSLPETRPISELKNTQSTAIPTMPPEELDSGLSAEIAELELPLQEANGALRTEDESSIPSFVAEASAEPLIEQSLDEIEPVENAAPMLVAAANPNDMQVPVIDEQSQSLTQPVTSTDQVDEAVAMPITEQSSGAVEDNATSTTTSSTEDNQEFNMPTGRAVGAQEVVGSINTNGPEYWPEDAGISTTLPNKDADNKAEQSGQSVSTAVQPPSGTAQEATEQSTSPDAEQSKNTTQTTTVPVEQAGTADVRQDVNIEGKPELPVVEEEPRPVIYQDEEGNVVEKPPVPEELFAKATELINASKYTEAVPILEQLKAMPNISREMREQVLYNLSDALFVIYDGKPLEGFEPISSVTNEAMNVNLRSTRVPDALYRLGVVNLGVGNFAEAEAYFKALKRRYPYDVNIPTAFYQLGKAQFDKGLYADAEKNFRMIVEEFPDASALDEATTHLVKALTELKKYKDAKVFADFAGMRWARYYVEDPDYISYLAEIEYNLGDKEAALKHYWLLYNLDPKNERSADVLAKIGDLYFETGRSKAALEVFGEIEARFPKSNAAALAYLRRSEQGIYDSPINLAEMFSVFENPGSPLPQVAYKTLQKNYPNDKRSITSELKYAIWQLWNREYTDAMGSAADFIDLHPENIDAELAKDVIMRGFMADLKNSLAEENYGRVLILWNGFPIVRERYGPIDPELRNALGRGYLERGEDENAMEMLADFLKTPQDSRYSEPTFALYFNKYLESGNWNGMLDLGELVKDWKMPPAMRGQLDYALALAAENLGLKDRALVLWKQLADNQNIQLYQRAYATYFLAKDAEERQDIKEAYAYNLKTLELFEKLQEERSDRADVERVKEAIGSLMDITEVSNRIPEALEWVEKYGQFVPEDSPEYPGLRFREARLYRKLGNDERARLLLEIIVNNYASSPFATAAATELSTFEMSRDLRNFLPGGQAGQGG